MRVNCYQYIDNDCGKHNLDETVNTSIPEQLTSMYEALMYSFSSQAVRGWRTIRLLSSESKKLKKGAIFIYRLTSIDVFEPVS